MPLTKPSAILFDWDNTLVNTWPTIHESLYKTFETMGHEPWTMEETKQRVHRSMRDAFPDIFGDQWQKAAELYQQNFRAIHLDRLESLPDTEHMLKALTNRKDIYTAVVSNKMGVNLRKEVTHIGWNNYFSKVVGATDANEDKPDPAPVHMALDGTTITAGESVWFVGDSVTDMECAHNSGCVAVFFGEKDENDGSFVHCPPNIHFENHQALIKALESF